LQATFRGRLTRKAEADLDRPFACVLERELERDGGDLSQVEQAVAAIRAGYSTLKASPFTCRKAGQSPFLRELIIPSGRSGCVALIEIGSATDVVVVAVRHQFEDDFHRCRGLVRSGGPALGWSGLPELPVSPGTGRRSSIRSTRDLRPARPAMVLATPRFTARVRPMAGSGTRVDLHGLKAALVERAPALGMSPCGFVGSILAVALDPPQTGHFDRARPLQTHGRCLDQANRARLCLRRDREQARATVDAARRAGSSPGGCPLALRQQERPPGDRG